MKFMGILMYCVIAFILLISTILIIRACMKSKMDGEINKKQLIKGMALIILGIVVLFLNTDNRYIFRIITGVLLMPGSLIIYAAVANNGKAKGIVISLFMIAIVTLLSIGLIGLPNKPPIITMDKTELIVGQTSVSDLLVDDFTILVRTDDINFSDDLYTDDILDGYYTYDGSSSYVISPNENNKIKNGNLHKTRSTFYIEKNNLIYGAIQIYIAEDTELKDAVICNYSFFMETYGRNVTPDMFDQKLSIQLNGEDIFKMTGNDFSEMYPEAEAWIGNTMDYDTRTSNSTTYNYTVRFTFKNQEKTGPLIEVRTVG